MQSVQITTGGEEKNKTKTVSYLFCGSTAKTVFALISLLSSEKLNRIFRVKASQNNCDNFRFVFSFGGHVLEF